MTVTIKRTTYTANQDFSQMLNFNNVLIFEPNSYKTIEITKVNNTKVSNE